MSYIKLNGVEFDAEVAISAYNRNFNVLDGDNAGRVMTGRMVRDIIGTYIASHYGINWGTKFLRYFMIAVVLVSIADLFGLISLHDICVNLIN